MGEEMVKSQLTDSALSVADIKTQMDMIQNLMRTEMKEGRDYGKIPGCGDKPTLYKSGSEIVLTMFHIGVDPKPEDLSTSDEIRYRVMARLFHQSTGTFLGAGVGEASSSEDKYKWRSAVCDEEFEMFPENMRRIKFKKWSGGVNKIKQVRNNPSDIANTILKMAKKRAQVDGTLTVTAASAIFTQDVEDLVANGVIMPKETNSKEPIKMPEAEDATENKIVSGDMATAFVKIIDVTKTKTGKPVTNYTVLSVDKSQEMIISIWGSGDKGINAGDKCLFKGVTSREYKGKTYWAAESVEPVIEKEN